MILRRDREIINSSTIHITFWKRVGSVRHSEIQGCVRVSLELLLLPLRCWCCCPRKGLSGGSCLILTPPKTEEPDEVLSPVSLFCSGTVFAPVPIGGGLLGLPPPCACEGGGGCCTCCCECGGGDARSVLILRIVPGPPASFSCEKGQLF